MQDRIVKITEYFKGLEICDGIVIVKIVYPNKWVIPSDNLLDELFKVKVVKNKQGEGYFYCCEITDGVTPTFDAIDFTIEFNRDLEEKSELLKTKVDELKQLFAEKSIEILRTIEFKYSEKKTKNKKNKKTEDIITNEDKIECPQEIINKTDNDTPVKPNSNNIDGDNLVEYAIKLITD